MLWNHYINCFISLVSLFSWKVSWPFNFWKYAGFQVVGVFGEMDESKYSPFFGRLPTHNRSIDCVFALSILIFFRYILSFFYNSSLSDFRCLLSDFCRQNLPLLVVFANVTVISEIFLFALKGNKMNTELFIKTTGLINPYPYLHVTHIGFSSWVKCSVIYFII